MPRPFLRARATLLTALIGMVMAPAQAADLFGLPEAPALVDEPVEWGSNWYLRGDIGWEQIRVPVLSGDFGANLNSADIAMGALGGGYQFNEWLRADLTVDRSVFRGNGIVGQIWCPTGGANGICSRYVTASLVRTSLMANAYFDIFHFWGLTPYVGAGAGMTYNSAASSIGESNGILDPVQLPFGPTGWNISASKSGWKFAWNVMAGVSYDVTQNLKVDLGYRYLNAGRFTGVAGYGWTAVPVTKDITAHEVRLGVRVTTN